jgi:hypothetical protein
LLLFSRRKEGDLTNERSFSGHASAVAMDGVPRSNSEAKAKGGRFG